MLHNNLACAYTKLKQLPEAEVEFLEEIKINPNYSDAYYNLGLVYKQSGKIDDAIRLWKKTLSLNPSHNYAKNQLERIKF